MKTAEPPPSHAASPIPAGNKNVLPLHGWALELARRWNGGTYSVLVLHGNVFDLFAVQDGERVSYVPLKSFLTRRLFPERSCLLFYDIAGGLTFGSADIQKKFFEWLELFDTVEGTNFRQQGPPKSFVALAPLLTRFFLKVAEDQRKWKGVTLVVNYPEKIIPAGDHATATAEERVNLVTFLKWASAPELSRVDVGILLVTESASELHPELLRHPHVVQVRIDLPDPAERLRFVQSDWTEKLSDGRPITEWSDFSTTDLAARTAGLNLLRIQDLLAEALRNHVRVTAEFVAATRKRLIEEYCEDLVRFKDPRPGVTLDRVATHTVAKQKLRELAWLIKNGKGDVLDRGILVPGRVGVGKSFLIDCFASECGLPVMELGEFRSRWTGNTERQQGRILMTIRALGPVIVVLDEANAVFGSYDTNGDTGGASGGVFAAFAAHIGDSASRGRDLWVAMTSRPDLLSTDMRRQGRFGSCVPLFPAQGPADVLELFSTIAGNKNIALADKIKTYIRKHIGDLPLTGNDVETILTRSKERAILGKRDDNVQLADVEDAVSSFIDPADPEVLALQELAAVLSCSDRRYLPEKYRDADRSHLLEQFAQFRLRAGRR